MRRPYIPMLAFACYLLLLHLPFSSDFTTSVIPGWHVSVISPLLATSTVLSIILLAVIFIYWKLPRWAGHIPFSVFVPHFLLSLPVIVITRFPEHLLSVIWQYSSLATPEEQSRMIYHTILTTSFLFLAGQIILIGFTCAALFRAHRHNKTKS